MRYFPAIFLLAFFSRGVGAEQAIPGWDTFVLTPMHAPLELKMGPLGVGDDPDVAVIILWNDQGANLNDMGAYIVPPPYDGSSVTFESFSDTGATFAVGDLCTTPTSGVVPFVKDFDLRIARRVGSAWSLQTLSQTLTEHYDSSDCAVNVDGLFVSAHNMTDNTIEIYRSLNDGVSFSLFTTISDADPIIGPYGGAIRDTMAASSNSSELGVGYQTQNGSVKLAVVDTSLRRGLVETCPVFQGLPVVGFTRVKESAMSDVDSRFLHSYDLDGNARMSLIDPGTCQVANHDFGVLPVGTQHTWYGFTAACSHPNRVNQLSGDYHMVDPSEAFGSGFNLVHVEADPFTDTGGPRTSYTYYGSYYSSYAAAGIDQREPLATTYGSRYVNFGTNFEDIGSTIWRDGCLGE